MGAPVSRTEITTLNRVPRENLIEKLIFEQNVKEALECVMQLAGEIAFSSIGKGQCNSHRREISFWSAWLTSGTIVFLKTEWVSTWLVKEITQPNHRKPYSHCKDFGFSEWDEGILEGFNGEMLSSVQLLRHVRLFVTPWTATCQASLFITNYQRLLKLMPIDSVMPSNHLILCSPSHPAFNLSLHQGLFQWVSSSHQVAKLLELQLQHQSFQWIFRTEFL